MKFLLIIRPNYCSACCYTYGQNNSELIYIYYILSYMLFHARYGLMGHGVLGTALLGGGGSLPK
jgi:hypothetical protein